jgi:acetylornithine deacetylase
MAITVWGTNAHVGECRSGSALNSVPDRAEILAEDRTIGADDPDGLVCELADRSASRIEPAMRPIDPAARVELRDHAAFLGLDTATDAQGS